MEAPDVVVLVPGLLGFARFGGFYYFADRVVATLRGHLQETLGYPVPVVPCTALPTHPLAARQQFLLTYLRRLSTERLRGVERIHLVGHSTGGVDAQLLTCTQPLRGGVWDAADEVVRRKIASVVTIAAPHYGTCLADSRLAKVGENPLAHPSALPGLLATLADLVALIPREAAALAGLQVALPNDVLKFLFQVASNRDLIGDLRPAAMERIRGTFVADRSVPVTCFVVGTMPRSDSERPSDPFFVDLYGLAQTNASAASPSVHALAQALQRAVQEQPGLVMCSEQGRLPDPIDPSLNDGVVNTVRQLLPPDTPAEIGGFAVADHGDVLGHYDRRDALVEGPPLNEGLFHSGAGFADDQFFTLYQRVARAIVKGSESFDRGKH